MRPIILKTGSTFADLAGRRGDFEDWFAARLGRPLRDFHVIDAQRATTLPDPTSADAVLVTGSSATVHEHDPWSDRAGAWLRAAVQSGVPVLGVCYGHQLLADAFGGRTSRNPNGREIGLTTVHIAQDDPLFEGLPPVFPVFETHLDAVVDVPQSARVLAGNARCPVQALAFGPRAWGVQWHPEFDDDAMRHYLHVRRPQIEAELGAGETDRLLRAVQGTPPSGDCILRNFWRLATAT